MFSILLSREGRYLSIISYTRQERYWLIHIRNHGIKKKAEVWRELLVWIHFIIRRDNYHLMRKIGAINIVANHTNNKKQQKSEFYSFSHLRLLYPIKTVFFTQKNELFDFLRSAIFSPFLSRYESSSTTNPEVNKSSLSSAKAKRW